MILDVKILDLLHGLFADFFKSFRHPNYKRFQSGALLPVSLRGIGVRMGKGLRPH